MEKVIAVIVTHNRQELLARCVNALRNQTKKPDSILVINNDSSDATAQWLKDQNDIISITQKNLGSGGGFNTGISWAYQHNYSWIWCMDDDGYPKEDALENVLAPETDLLCLRNCAVINEDNKKSFVWKTKNFANIDEVDNNLIYGIGHPFNGTMIHRNIVERVGTPKTALFLWGDESEYYYRITKRNKIPVCTIANSIHYHPASAFTYKRDWDYKSCWKVYFYVRNRYHVHRSKFSFKFFAVLNYICFLTAMSAVVLLFQKTDKLKKLYFISWPAIDAFNNNMKATPLMILHRLNKNPWLVFRNAFTDQLKSIRVSVQLFVAFPKVKRATGI